MSKSNKIILAAAGMILLNLVFGQLWLDVINNEKVSDTLAWVSTIVIVAMNVGCIMATIQLISRHK